MIAPLDIHGDRASSGEENTSTHTDDRANEVVVALGELADEGGNRVGGQRAFLVRLALNIECISV